MKMLALSIESVILGMNAGLAAYNIQAGNIVAGSFNIAVTAFILPFAIWAAVVAAQG